MAGDKLAACELAGRLARNAERTGHRFAAYTAVFEERLTPESSTTGLPAQVRGGPFWTFFDDTPFSVCAN
jgi:hypothetical protein